jgi:hypothetical protein
MSLKIFIHLVRINLKKMELTSIVKTAMIFSRNYNNLQPLCSKVNRDIKRDKLDFNF